MRSHIQSISIEGFKSIRRLQNFPLNPGLNVLIGANGAGKSNFVEFFKLMEMLISHGLNDYVAKMGGADTFLFQGTETTEAIAIAISITDNGRVDNHYEFLVNRTVENNFIEASIGKLPYIGRSLSNDEIFEFQRQRDEVLNKAIKNWRVYHFQNTSSFSSLRKDASAYNDKEFLADGSNLPAFLRTLQKGESGAYEKIRGAVKQIMPVFDDFVLEPEENETINDKFVRLRWRQKGSRYLFQPWQMSDGTLRFLALTVALLQPNPPDVIVIDEPELGLHPASLNTLAGFMHEAAFRSQLIVTTQSPDLLNTMEPEDVVTVNMRNGESVFNRLSRADLGDWLEDYTIGDLWWKNVIQAGPTYV